MRSTLLLTTLLATGCCSEEATVSFNDTRTNEPQVMIESENVHTYEEFRSYLQQRYGEVEELPVTAIITSGIDTSVPFKYRLNDGREFTVPIIFTAANRRIVDSEFDLNSLPN